MNKQHSKGIFSFLITEQLIILQKSVPLSLSEVDSLTSLLNIVLGMRSLPVLPPHIEDETFKIEFDEDGSFTIIKDNKALLVPNLKEVDDLAVGLNEAKQIALDTTLLGGKVRPAAYQNLRADGSDIIEGR